MKVLKITEKERDEGSEVKGEWREDKLAEFLFRLILYHEYIKSGFFRMNTRQVCLHLRLLNLQTFGIHFLVILEEKERSLIWLFLT